MVIKREPDRVAQKEFLTNYFKFYRNVEKACAATKTKKGTLNSRTVRKWKAKDPVFRAMMAETIDQWGARLFEVAYEEATGTGVQAIYRDKAKTQIIGYQQNRPVPVLLIFLLKAIDPDTYDDNLRLNAAKLDGRLAELRKFPLPVVKFADQTVPDRIAKDPRQAVPAEHLEPPPALPKLPYVKKRPE